MYKLLLVDDDPLVCEGMKHIINWSNFGIDITHTALSGTEALNILHALDIDIMITDISMPDISGVTLIAEALRYQPELKCLVLSGYDDYQYVRSAMRAGALDYHLKPVAKDELEESIVALLSSLEDKKSHRQPSNQPLLERTMQRFLNNNITPKERLEKFEILQLNPNPNTVIMGLIKCTDQPDMIHSFLEYFRLSHLEVTLFYISNDILCVLCTSSQDSADTSNIISALQKCVDRLRSEVTQPVCSVLSKVGRGWRQVPALYQQALFLLDYLELSEHVPSCIFQWNAGINEYDISVAEVRLLLQSNSVLDFYHFLEKNFSEQNIQKRDSHADCLALSILRKFLSVSSDLLIPETILADIRTKTIKNIASADSLPSLKRKLYPLANDLSTALAKANEREYSLYIKQTLSIITSEYADSTLSLKTIADRLYVNATYLGKQFKNETGSYFNDYLAKIRVQCAETILVTTDLKLIDIAEQVGFSSENYFISVFKKITSVTPGNIRRIIEAYEKQK